MMQSLQPPSEKIPQKAVQSFSLMLLLIGYLYTCMIFSPRTAVSVFLILAVFFKQIKIPNTLGYVDSLYLSYLHHSA